MKHADRLDKASSIFFLIGFVVSKLQHAPFAILSMLSNLGTLFFYSIGYTLWLVACQMYPDQPAKKQFWYGFAQFKNQHRVSAVLGAVAIVCCVIAISFPIALVPANWLFVLSNCIWCIAEYHKKQNPPTDNQNYSSSQQSAYLRYAIVSTTMLLLTAIATTIATLFPPLAIFVFAASTLLGISLGAVAFYCWVDCTLNDHKPDYQSNSYTMLSETLGAPSNTIEHSQTYDVAPINSPPLFKHQTIITPSATDDHNQIPLVY